MKWYYLEHGQPAGPYTEEEMAKLVSAGRIDAATLAAREGSNEWLPLEQACELATVGNVAAANERRRRRWAVALRVVFLLLACLLGIWPIAALFGTISFFPSSHPILRLYFYAFLAYPVVLGLSWWQARRAIRAAKALRGFLWALPPLVIMSPLIWGFMSDAAYPLVGAFNRHGTSQGRFMNAIVRRHSAEEISQHLARGADANGPTTGTFLPTGTTPLSAALMYNRDPDIIAALLKAGANPNAGGALRDAVALPIARTDANTPRLVAMLLEAGADPRIESVLHEAIANNQSLSVIKMLVERGAGVETRDHWGRTPLMLAAHKNAHLNVTGYLLSRGADVNAVTPKGTTVLMYAAQRPDCAQFVRLLVGRGARVNVSNADGDTALAAAARHAATPEGLRLLIHHGAQLDAQDRWGRTPLMDAAMHNGSSEVTEFLIRSGAELEARNKHGRTAFMLAAYERNYRACDVLAAHGANTAVRDDSGRTTRDWIAMMQGQEDIDAYERWVAEWRP